jgi:hypothetical protein
VSETVTLGLFTVPREGESRVDFAARLVVEARGGSQPAMATIANIRENADKGNPEAVQTFEAIRCYIAEHPVHEKRTMNLFEARKLARECMYDDQLAAIEAVARAILANPDDPGLPTVEPPVEGQDPQTGVHAQGTTKATELDPRLHRDFGVTPSLLEVVEEQTTSVSEENDFEKAWEAHTHRHTGLPDAKVIFKEAWDAAHSCYDTAKPTGYERGWRAGRGAAVRAIEDLVSQSVRQSPEEVAWVTALNVVNALEVKGEP